MSNRHFALFEANGEEVIILGYRQKTNEVLICFPSALSQTEAQTLRNLVQSADAQKKDFLMDTVGGSVLGAAHHTSGVDWQTFLLRQASTGRSNAVRRATMKDLKFQDQSQKAYFAGYGPSIEPEVDALRKSRIQAQTAVLNGRPVPEALTQANVAPTPAPAEAAPAAPAEAAPSANDALVAAMTSIAQGQAAILEQLAAMNKPAKKTTTRRKTTTKRKPAAKKAEEAPAEAVTESTSDAADVSMTASSFGGNE